MEMIDEWTQLGMRRTIYTQLEHRFGSIAPRMKQAIEKVPAELLDQLSVAVLDFNSMDEAMKWIAKHSRSATRK